jgi:hypothetical protein
MKQTKNTVVLSGLQLKEPNDGNKMTTSGEFDFIFISLPLKSIIHIEAKIGNSNSNRKSASKQLKRGQTFFQDNLPLPASENWKYVKMMCFGESVDNDICEQCKPFILSCDFIEDKTTQSISDKIGQQFLSSINKIFITEDPLQSISREIAQQLHPHLSPTISVDQAKGDILFGRNVSDIL